MISGNLLLNRDNRAVSQVLSILGSDRGIALLMVMWILTVLVVISLSFAFMTRTQTRATLFFKEGIEKQFLAEAGVQRAIAELQYRALYKNNPTATLDNAEVMKVDAREYTGQSGEDSYTYKVLDESAKINLNTLTDISGIILNNLLVNQGVEKERAETIVDSLLDWRDADDLHRNHGAESDYYMSLPNPYRARNADLDTVEEMLMIKGMTPEILYGSGDKRGIYNFVTVSSKATGVNVNTAPKEVLAALPGMSTELAEKIVEFRTAAEIKTTQVLQSVVPEAYALFAPHINTTESTIYMIQSTGRKKDVKTGYTVKTIINFEGNGKYQTLYYKSPAGNG